MHVLLSMLVAGYLLHAVAGDEAPTTYSKTGCVCLGNCDRTIDSPFTPWCYTSDHGITVMPDNGQQFCGRYSLARQAFWDECSINVTTGGGGDTGSLHLSTFQDMWSYMTIAATAATAAGYCIMGCIASVVTSPRRTLWWLPISAATLGGCHGFLIGSIFAAIVSFMYLSMPYAINVNVAVSLGMGVAVMLTYGGLGRYSRKAAAPHASEYEE